MSAPLLARLRRSRMAAGPYDAGTLTLVLPEKDYRLTWIQRTAPRDGGYSWYDLNLDEPVNLGDSSVHTYSAAGRTPREAVLTLTEYVLHYRRHVERSHIERLRTAPKNFDITPD